MIWGKSWAIGEARVKNKHLGSDQRDFHDLIWLHHADLQLGKYHDAREILDTLAQEISHMNAVQYWAAGPQNSKTPKKRGLAEVQKNEEVQVDDLEISRFASELSVTALEAISHSNFKEAEAVISRIKKRIQAPKPPYEFLGDLYSQSGRYQEAMSQYQISLRKTQPHRSLTLLGLAQAAKRAGDTETCRSVLSELKKNWESADAEVKHGLDNLQCGQE